MLWYISTNLRKTLVSLGSHYSFTSMKVVYAQAGWGQLDMYINPRISFDGLKFLNKEKQTNNRMLPL